LGSDSAPNTGTAAEFVDPASNFVQGFGEAKQKNNFLHIFMPALDIGKILFQSVVIGTQFWG